jgi:hypothetical protein
MRKGMCYHPEIKTLPVEVVPAIDRWHSTLTYKKAVRIKSPHSFLLHLSSNNLLNVNYQSGCLSLTK